MQDGVPECHINYATLRKKQSGISAVHSGGTAGMEPVTFRLKIIASSGIVIIVETQKRGCRFRFGVLPVK